MKLAQIFGDGAPAPPSPAHTPPPLLCLQAAWAHTGLATASDLIFKEPLASLKAACVAVFYSWLEHSTYLDEQTDARLAQLERGIIGPAEMHTLVRMSLIATEWQSNKGVPPPPVHACELLRALGFEVHVTVQLCVLEFVS